MMQISRRLVAAGASAGLAATVGLLAGAGMAGARVPQRLVRELAGGQVTTTAVTSETESSGYMAAASGNATVAATLTVPKLKCTKKVTEPDWVTVLLNGETTSSGATMFLTCDAGDTLSLMVDQATTDTITVHAGDVIRVSVTATATSDAETYTDQTTGATASGSGTGFAPNDLQIENQGGDADGGVFPGFSPLTFSSVTLNGASLKAAHPTRINQVSTAGITQVKASALTQHGESFTDTFITG